MLTISLLLFTLLPCVADNIKPVLSESIEIHHELAVAINDSSILLKSLNEESTTLDITNKNSYFLGNKQMLRYLILEHINTRPEKDVNRLLQIEETEKLETGKLNYKRNLHIDDQDMETLSEEYFKLPTGIQSTSVSFYRGLQIPIHIHQFEEQEISDPDVDNRIITTLMHSQMRVEPKIVQGIVAQARDFPFLVSLKRIVQKFYKTNKLWKNYCGGSIITANKVVTAAHCFEINKYDYYYHPNKLRVVAGNLWNKLYHSGDFNLLFYQLNSLTIKSLEAE